MFRHLDRYYLRDGQDDALWVYRRFLYRSVFAYIRLGFRHVAVLRYRSDVCAAVSKVCFLLYYTPSDTVLRLLKNKPTWRANSQNAIFLGET